MPNYLVGDASRLQQILLNLIENAFKYSFKHGGVIVRVEIRKKTDDSIYLWFGISDCGMGIPNEELPRLTKAFEQMDDSFTRKQQGAGLGLAIVSELIKLMGGQLNINSVCGIGTRVEFIVPFKLVEKDNLKNINTQLLAQKQKPLNVLVAEDNLINQRLLLSLLKKDGHTVTLAKDGGEALKASQENKFDIILMDIQMPIMSGLEVLHQIRSETENLNFATPVIAVTANAAHDDEEKYIEFGMNGYLSKPINIGNLRSFIMQLDKAIADPFYIFNLNKESND